MIKYSITLTATPKRAINEEMKLGELILIVLFVVVAAGLVGYYFSDYLFARVIRPTNDTITVKQGQALSVQTDDVKSTSTIKIQICGSGAGGGSCFPITVNARKSPVFTRIPIGFPTGPGSLQAIEETSSGNQRTLFTVKIIVQR